jgi:hypothetical protein
MVARAPTHRPLFGVLAGVPAGDYQTRQKSPQRRADARKGFSGVALPPKPLRPLPREMHAASGEDIAGGIPRRASRVRSPRNDPR